MRLSGNPFGARRGERGQSLIELAISLFCSPCFAFGVDVGRAFFSLISIREAAEEGALYGSLNPQDDPGIIQRVRTSSTTPVDLTDTSLVAVGVSTTGASCAGSTLVVTVTYQFQLTMPLVGTIIGTQNFPLAVSASSTILRPAC